MIHEMLFKVIVPVLILQINFPSNYAISDEQAFWRQKSLDEIKDSLNIEWNHNTAKNIILFVGDGMGLTTITTSRIYAVGEEGFLSWEKFDHIGVLKTYSNNKLVPDSCSTATALFCGVKANHKTAGVDGSVSADDCEASLNPKAHAPSIFNWAIESGKATGFVTTTRVTHATPSALYAHIANRKWECEASMPPNATKCKDIARQLIEDSPGRDINVIMGGGRQVLTSNSSSSTGDPLDTWSCISSDGRNLVQDWKKDKMERKVSHALVTNNEELQGLQDSAEFVMGIFANGHLAPNYRRDPGPKGMPSLWNMTEKAINILSKNRDGYILVVEAGLIDMSHHRGHARQALDETKALSEAVAGTMSIIDNRETLVIVTSDHSHSLMFLGHIDRNKGIFDVADVSKVDKTPYTALLYGSGNKDNFQFTVENGSSINRRNPLMDKTDDYKYSQQTGILEEEASHGGTDVLIYATGPMSHLVHSVKEQTFVAYLISYAAQIGPAKNLRSGALPDLPTFSMILITAALFLLMYLVAK